MNASTHAVICTVQRQLSQAGIITLHVDSEIDKSHLRMRIHTGYSELKFGMWHKDSEWLHTGNCGWAISISGEGRATINVTAVSLPDLISEAIKVIQS